MEFSLLAHRHPPYRAGDGGVPGKRKSLAQSGGDNPPEPP